MDVQSENRVLILQLKDAKTDLKDQQDQVKYLTQEKWQLAQEKAQLEGGMSKS